MRKCPLARRRDAAGASARIPLRVPGRPRAAVSGGPGEVGQGRVRGVHLPSHANQLDHYGGFEEPCRVPQLCRSPEPVERVLRFARNLGFCRSGQPKRLSHWSLLWNHGEGGRTSRSTRAGAKRGVIMPGAIDDTLKHLTELSPRDWVVQGGWPAAPAQVIDADIATISGATEQGHPRPGKPRLAPGGGFSGRSRFPGQTSGHAAV